MIKYFLVLFFLVAGASAANLVDLYPNAIEEYTELGITIPKTEVEFTGAIQTKIITAGGTPDDVERTISVSKKPLGKSGKFTYNCINAVNSRNRVQLNTKTIAVAYSWYVEAVSSNLADWEAYLVNLPLNYQMNEVRGESGLPALTEYAPLTILALEKAKNMADGKSSPAFTKENLSCTDCASIDGFAINNKSMLDGWMGRDCEKGMLLERNFTRTGTGIADADGFKVFVQIFSN